MHTDAETPLQTQDIRSFIRGIPKAELHVHLEGTIEPSLLLELAKRNGVPLRWTSPTDLRNAYNFDNLQSFLDLYFQGCKVLITRQDFYDVTLAYLERAHADNVVRAEVFLGPQSFTENGTPLEDLMGGILDAIDDAEQRFGISAGYIVSTHRHRTEADALEVLDSIMPWKDRITGIGMGGPEVPHPPSKFVNFFAACRERGFRTCVHAGEEGPSSYVRQAIELLHVDRIDHGIACLSDPDLVAELAAKQIPLTVCPVSNLRLKVVPSLNVHPLRALLHAGVKVTVNSDNPPYFDAYVNDNYLQCQAAAGLKVSEVITLARNSITSCFLPEQEITRLLSRLEKYCEDHNNVDIERSYQKS